MAVNWDKLGGAASSLFGSLGQFDVAKSYKSQAKGYQRAAETSLINKDIARQASEIEMVQADRDIYQNLGAQVAATGASGLEMSGSALDVLRDSSTQASLTKQLLGRQSAIEQLAYEQEATSYAQMAAASTASGKAAKKSAVGGLIGAGLDIATSFIPGGGIVKGLVKGIGKLFSDDTLKEDIVLIRRRPDGLGIYAFRYKGQPTLFTGVLASEVERLYPAAVSHDEEGHKMVDYDMIAVTPGKVDA